jgi:hypothetical protein
MALAYDKREAKKWARQYLKGLEAVIFPSFTPDLQNLDEEGIRYDVNHLVANGFTYAMVAPEVCGLTPRGPEEEFYVGRVNYAKGARLKKFSI